MRFSRKLIEADLENLIVGASIFSSGGGGSPANALNTVRKISKTGLSPKLVDPAGLPSRALVFAPGDVGGGITPEEEKRYRMIYKEDIPIKWKKWPWEKWSPASIRELSDYMKREPDAFLTIETGPGSFLSVIFEAAKLGKPIVDGDTVGRAVPEMTMSKLYLNNARILASAATSHFGDVIILKQIQGFRRMEDIARSFASASGGGVGLVSAFDGSTVRSGTLPNSMSQCISLGAKVQACGEGDLAKTIQKETGGMVLFTGTLEDVESEPKLGYLFGTYTFSGKGDYAEDDFKIWFKNENHVAWKNGTPVATSPDIIAILDPDKRGGIWNWDEVPKGKELIVLGIPSDKIWRTKRGLEVLGPRAFGFDLDYRSLSTAS